MTTILAIVSDLHVNSTVGLCPEQMVNDDGLTVLPSKSQQWLRAQWVNFWQDVDLAGEHYKVDSISVIVNGDWGDKNRHSQYQLITLNEGSIIDWMVDVMQPVRSTAERIFVVRGTEAHTGGAGWMEEQAAQDIGAVVDPNTGLSSWWVFRGTLEGVNVLATHHPGTNGTRPWTMGAAANRAAAMVMDAHYNDDWKPHLAVFGHVHHYEDSGDNHPVRAIFNRPWTLIDAYSHRHGYGIASPSVGGLIVVCRDGNLRVIPRGYQLPRAKPWRA